MESLICAVPTANIKQAPVARNPILTSPQNCQPYSYLKFNFCCSRLFQPHSSIPIAATYQHVFQQQAKSFFSKRRKSWDQNFSRVRRAPSRNSTPNMAHRRSRCSGRGQGLPACDDDQLDLDPRRTLGQRPSFFLHSISSFPYHSSHQGFPRAPESVFRVAKHSFEIGTR